MTSGPTYCRRQRLPFRKLDEQTVILNPRGRDVHILNGTGTLIWELLSEGHSADELVGLLNGHRPFDADAEEMARDVAGFLAELATKGLVVAEPIKKGRDEP
jgi:hypothetical protein